jgi:hypothetical protein
VLARIRGRLTYADVMATIAMFIALGGTSLAAKAVIDGSNLKDRSVAGKKIEKNALTGKEVAERKLGTVPSATRTITPPAREVGKPGQPRFAAYPGQTGVCPPQDGCAWGNYGDPAYNAVGFYKDAGGVVHLRGLACYRAFNSCVAGNITEGGAQRIFTLPRGFRPARQGVFATVSNARVSAANGNPDAGHYYASRVDVTKDGVVQATKVDDQWVSLDGITFRASH